MATTLKLVRRSFGVSSGLRDIVKAPIQVFGVEGRYAHAIFSAAARKKKLEEVEKELQGVKSVIESNSSLFDYLTNPIVKRDHKKETLQELLKKSSPITVNLFNALAENNRLGRTLGVIGAYDRIMSAHRGEVECVVTAAKQLTEPELKELKASLSGFLQKGQALKLETKIDSSLLGGLVVEIGDKRIDMTVKAKVKKIRDLLMEAV
ncbi:ATP synthase subunit O, mitochondrial-like [Corticium candelabrum]|uniref:ATP synthase subunit O, mitochondrial-like n=1 Tax=Corticium candelabrum TaxID=121492 RepID=UPI002E259648|nr:ATP synthase subunit O, mitochondrial-like [Corticium candelabrum]